MTASRRASLRDGIFKTSFAPGPERTRVGVEVELLAQDAATGFPRPLLGNVHALVPLIRAYAVSAGWSERAGYGDVPYFDIPGRATISFEPGGQIEISTLPCDSVSDLVCSTQSVVAELASLLGDAGVRLESLGIDPLNDARAIPLQLAADRYETMTRYVERIGPYGIRMMRQTAAIQVSLDRGPRPADRWRLLNDLAPYVVAVFANSRYYCGADTGHRSFRAHCWRQLDPSRTGVALPSDDPAGAYTDFALSANDMFQSADREHAVSFADREDDGDFESAWQTHLTTLFPEVRPRGHYEVRSCDAIDPKWYAAPVVFLYGLAYDGESSREAAQIAAGSAGLLEAAGERGLENEALAANARDLFQLALDGARRLGAARVGPAEVDVAVEFYRTYTARGRSPADDQPPPPPRLLNESKANIR
ncbi:MAG: glutamate-cysteine ligase family protein [Gemmatimonadaceae bacterium]